MFVRLNGPPSGKGAAGKWSDAATGEHGGITYFTVLTHSGCCGPPSNRGAAVAAVAVAWLQALARAKKSAAPSP
jgi:hypothetical protein